MGAWFDTTMSLKVPRWHVRSVTADDVLNGLLLCHLSCLYCITCQWTAMQVWHWHCPLARKLSSLVARSSLARSSLLRLQLLDFKILILNFFGMIFPKSSPSCSKHCWAYGNCWSNHTSSFWAFWAFSNSAASCWSNRTSLRRRSPTWMNLVCATLVRWCQMIL